jgi:flagellar basal body-associated protein FliL
MNIFEVIDKLELIKHKYLINKLEKYTEQVAAATTPVATTTPLAPPPAPPATTPPAPSTPPAPPAKPVEEAKKPSEEAVKFENNMMDTLKWVFIGIAIFVVILIILGVVYWFMFGSSSSTTSSSENVVDENGNIVDGAEGANAEANADAINNQQDPNDPYAYNEAPVSQDPYSDNLDNNVSNASSTSMFSSLMPLILIC